MTEIPKNVHEKATNEEMYLNKRAIELQGQLEPFIKAVKENPDATGVCIYSDDVIKNDKNIVNNVGNINMIQIGYPSVNKELALKFIIEDTKYLLNEQHKADFLTESEVLASEHQMALFCIKTLIDGFNLNDTTFDLNKLKEPYENLLVKNELD